MFLSGGRFCPPTHQWHTGNEGGWAIGIMYLALTCLMFVDDFYNHLLGDSVSTHPSNGGDPRSTSSWWCGTSTLTFDVVGVFEPFLILWLILRNIYRLFGVRCSGRGGSKEALTFPIERETLG